MRLDRLLEGLYLRAYAKNLARSYRSDPVNAASDAQIQISTLILIVSFILFIVLGSLFFPTLLTRFLQGRRSHVWHLTRVDPGGGGCGGDLRVTIKRRN